MKKIFAIIMLLLMSIQSSNAAIYYYQKVDPWFYGPCVAPFCSETSSSLDVDVAFSSSSILSNANEENIISYTITGSDANNVTLSISSSDNNIIDESSIAIDNINKNLTVYSSAIKTIGSAEISLIAKDSSGKEVDKDTIKITIKDPNKNQLTSWTVVADQTVQFPFNSSYFKNTYDGSVDWGDGSDIETFTGATIQSLSHTYTSAGTYDIKIYGDFCYETNFEGIFYNQTILEGFDVSQWDVSKVTNMKYAFESLYSLPDTFDISTWDVSSVENMYMAFAYSTLPSGFDISNWNVSSVTNAYMMFDYTTFNEDLDLSNWDVSNITDMREMFYGTKVYGNLNISDWDVSNVENDITNSFTSFYCFFMYANITGNLDINNWESTNDMDTLYFLENATVGGDININNWNIPNATKIQQLAAYVTVSGSININDWNAPNLTDIWEFVFYSKVAGGINITNWNAPNLANMENIFYLNYSKVPVSLGIDLSGLDFSNLTNIYSMFYDINLPADLTYNTLMSNSAYSQFLQTLANEKVYFPESTTSQKIIAGGNACATDDLLCFVARDTIIAKGWVIEDASTACVDCGINPETALETRWTVVDGETVTFPGGYYSYGIIDWGDGSDIETFAHLDNATHTYETAGTYTILMNGNWENSLHQMFTGSEIPSGFDISSWNVSNIEEMTSLFSGATLPAGFDISNWDTSNVTTTGYMFKNVTFPSGFSLENWDTTSLTNMSNMFNGATLPSEEFNLSKWDVSKVTNFAYLFSGATAPAGLNISSWDTYSDTSGNTAFDFSNITQNVTYNTAMSSSTYKYLLDKLSDLPSSTTNQKIIATGNACSPDDMDCYDARSIIEDKGWTVIDNTPLDVFEIDLSKALETKWTVSAGETVTFPVNTNSSYPRKTYNGFIDWGDGSLVERYGNLGETSHTYENAGTYTILINGNWEDDLSYMFYQKTIPSGFDISNWDTSGITNMSHMFSESIINSGLDISNWNTSNVTDLSYMFYKSTIPSGLDISNWNTSKVDDISGLFYDVSIPSGFDISNWDTSSVTSMTSVFREATIPSGFDISNWDTSNVKYMNYMFRQASIPSGFNISNWNTSNVTQMSYMFYLLHKGGNDPLDFSGWDISKVTSIYYMLYRSTLPCDINFSGWDMSKITSFKYLTYFFWWSGELIYNTTVSEEAYSSFVKILANSNVGFPNGNGRKIYVGDNVCASGDSACSSAESTLESKGWTFDRTSPEPVITIDEATALDTRWTVTAGETISFPFNNSYAGKIDWGDGSDVEEYSDLSAASHTYTSAGTYTILMNGDWETDFTDMFNQKTLPAGFDISHWNVSSITNMEGMFYNATLPSNLDLSSWNTSAVTNMSHMFYNTNIPSSIGINSWDVSSVTTMYRIFANATIPSGFDISNWDVSGIMNISSIFYSANITSGINLSSWDVSNATDITNMLNASISGNITYNTTMSSSLYSSFLQLLADTDVALPDSTTNQEIVAGSNACDASDTDCLDARNTIEGKGWVVNDATDTGSGSEGGSGTIYFRGLATDGGTYVDVNFTGMNLSNAPNITYNIQSYYYGCDAYPGPFISMFTSTLNVDTGVDENSQVIVNNLGNGNFRLTVPTSISSSDSTQVESNCGSLGVDYETSTTYAY